MKKQIVISYLFLDTTVCERCQTSDSNLRQAITILSTNYPEYNFSFKSIHIDSLDHVVKEQFISSPTIRINGADLPIELKESNCDCCGNYCGDDVDCRVWEYNGIEYDAAPVKLLVELISKYILGELQLKKRDNSYVIPNNFIHFFSSRLKKESFEEKRAKADCGCAPSCCN